MTACHIGLTGGIGAGKSEVARILADCGAVVIDADAIARSLLAPGGPAVADVEHAFPGVVSEGVVDRARLASIVFADDDALATLESITHPRVREETNRRVERALESDRCEGEPVVVIHDVPLIVEKGMQDQYQGVVVVWAPMDQRLARLSETRGMSHEDAMARIRAQASDEEREAVADVVVNNAGTLDDLDVEVRRVWEWCRSLCRN